MGTQRPDDMPDETPDDMPERDDDTTGGTGETPSTPPPLMGEHGLTSADASDAPEATLDALAEAQGLWTPAEAYEARERALALHALTQTEYARRGRRGALAGHRLWMRQVFAQGVLTQGRMPDAERQRRGLPPGDYKLLYPGPALIARATAAREALPEAMERALYLLMEAPSWN